MTTTRTIDETATNGSDVTDHATVLAAIGPSAGQVRRLPGPATSAALIVIDIQRSFADPAEMAAIGITDHADHARVADAIASCRDLVDAARAAGAQVVWVQLEQRPEAPWHASYFLRELTPETAGPCMAGTPGAEWYGIAPGAGEPVVSKRRYSGFVGTDLEGVLRSMGVTWVIPCGLTTECCIESTARDAFQLDFPVVMVEEASASYEHDDHVRSLQSLASNFAIVTQMSSLLKAWQHDAVGATGS